jgi:hypothetical protein
MASYVNVDGIMVAQGEGANQLFPSASDFTGGMGAPADLSLVPDLSMDTPVLWQAFGPGLGLPGTEAGAGGGAPAPRGRSGISIPWLLVGGLAIVMLGLRFKR